MKSDLFSEVQNRIAMLSKLQTGKLPVRFEDGDDEIEVFIGTSCVARYLWGDMG